MLADKPRRIAPVAASGARTAAGGFTLIEILVALAIAGLALVGLFQAGSGGVLAVDAAGQVNEATQRAQSHLAALGRIAAITPGETEGDDGDGYRWRVRARQLAAWQVGPAAAPVTITLFEVEIAISWRAGSRQAGGGHRSVVLNSLRLG
jgi:general secretion pathway protein I